ncbi:MAG: nuclear transport factor 2 family protein [SAR324 cluster bacterium]
MKPPAIEQWHLVVQSPTGAGLDRLLAEDVVFQSPVVHTPQVGKAITTKYLSAALKVLNNGSFHYLNEWIGATSAVLEFEVTVDGIKINGVDMIEWNSANQIVGFKVMVRPLKAINLLHQLMMRALQAPA